MPGEICYWIFNMSIIASAMGLIVMLLRKIRFLPHRVTVLLWIIPFFRMCIPFGLNSRYSLLSLISRLTTVTVYQPAEGISLSYSNIIMAADSYFPLTYKADFLETVFNVAGFVWLVVALAFLISLTFLYISTKKEISKSRHLTQNIYLSGNVDSPAVYGIFRPRIILPAYLEHADNTYIIRHEKTHIRRLDNLWRIVVFAIVAVHWFNPFAWLFLKTFLADLELACDETAIAGLDPEERKEYAITLLRSSRSKTVLVSPFGGAKVRTRIENVLSYRKMTVFSAVGSVALILVIIFTLITNAG